MAASHTLTPTLEGMPRTPIRGRNLEGRGKRVGLTSATHPPAFHFVHFVSLVDPKPPLDTRTNVPYH